MASSNALRVLIVLTSNARRGAEIEGERLGRELADHETKVDVVALAPASPGGTCLGVHVLGPAVRSASTLRALRRRVRRADIVVAFGSSTLPACAAATAGTDTPFVYRSIGDPAAWAHAGWRRIRTATMLRRAVRVVALWPGAEEAIHDLYRIPHRRLAVIANARSSVEFGPVDPDERCAARHRFGVGDADRLVLWIGALSPEKRVDLAIRAMDTLDESHRLVIAGAGPVRADMERVAKARLGDRVTFLGSVDDVGPLYAAADVLLMTSATEGMPGALIEAGLRGIPVVATDVGAVSWLFERGLRGGMVDATPTAHELGSALAAAIDSSAAERRVATAC